MQIEPKIEKSIENLSQLIEQFSLLIASDIKKAVKKRRLKKGKRKW